MGVETEWSTEANETGYTGKGLIFGVDGSQGQRSHAHWESLTDYLVLQRKDQFFH